MTAHKRNLKNYAVLVLVLIIVAFGVMPSYMWTNNRSSPLGSAEVGICAHSITSEDARLVGITGAKWIRIDISNNETDLSNSLANAKNYNLSVLGILGSWMFNKSCNFSLTEWNSAVLSNVSKYASYVDAWEIWNEPTSTQPGWELLTDYFSMVKVASPIIRLYDNSSKIVLLGGLQLYTGEPEAVQSDIDFARNMSTLNITQYGDALQSMLTLGINPT